jgi:sugar phosphate isomerase/epimerase
VRYRGSTASYPGLTFEAAIAQLSNACEPVLGPLSCDHVQLCPQSTGVLNEEGAARLRAASPETKFRLHANVRVHEAREVLDATHVATHRDYFRSLARIHHLLGADAYSLHAGRRAGPVASLSGVFANVLALEDLLGAPVAVEGLYPDDRRSFFLDDWSSYAELLASDVHFAIDLSHIQIVATRWGSLRGELVRELLACERCLEVHVSDNDGFRDQHRTLAGEPWWRPFLTGLHPNAIVFSEANHRRLRP